MAIKPNYAIKPTPELALRPSRALRPARLIAALAVFGWCAAFELVSKSMLEEGENVSSELDSRVMEAIRDLSELGNVAAESRDFVTAREAFQEAFELIPEPRGIWEASTWLLAAIGDVEFLSHNFESARNVLQDCMHCVGAIGNPFIHLRLGQAQYELNNLSRAADELTRAYMGAGKEIFESEDRKYFEFLKSVIKPPVSGSW